MPETHSASTSLDVAAPPDVVWRVLTDPELVRRYMHGATVETDWRVGSPVRWRGEWDGTPYEDKGEVLAADPPRHLAVTHWSPLTGDPDTPENYHHISYDLVPTGTGTTLTLTHGNAPDPASAEAMVETGWRPLLTGLAQVAEDVAR